MSHIKFLRKKRLLSYPLKRGKVKKEKLKEKLSHPIGAAILFALLCFVLGGVYFFHYMSVNFDQYYQQGKTVLFGLMSVRSWFVLWHSALYGLTPALLGFMGFFCVPPIFKILCFLGIERKLPARSDFKSYTITYRILALFTTAVVIVIILSTSADSRHHAILYGINFGSWNIPAAIAILVVEVLPILAVLSILVFVFMPKTEAKRRPSILSRLKRWFGREKFGLYIGQSTGRLVKRHHEAGIAKNQAVVLGQKDAAQNIIILGGLGVNACNHKH